MAPLAMISPLQGERERRGRGGERESEKVYHEIAKRTALSMVVVVAVMVTHVIMIFSNKAVCSNKKCSHVELLCGKVVVMVSWNLFSFVDRQTTKMPIEMTEFVR